MTLQEILYGFKVGDIIAVRGWDGWIPKRYQGEVQAIKNGLVHIKTEKGDIVEARITKAQKIG